MASQDLQSTSPPILKIEGIYKTFSMNAVLKGISLQLYPGDVLAIIGGNGAGKSTLMKIIMGIYKPDAGSVAVNGAPLTFKPAESLNKGVYLVPQEPMLFPNMSVEENILISFKGNRTTLRKRLNELLQRLGWQMDIARKASTLSIAEQQLVEILRGLMRQAKILILDEPTSALTFNEIQSLFKTIAELKAQGIGIMYITHRLNEVFEISTRVVIMRDGIVTMDGPVNNFTKANLVQALLPANAEEKAKSAQLCAPDYVGLTPALQIKNLCGYGFENISFNLYPGEILGLAGVVGAGRTELATTIFGKDVVKSGTVTLNAENITGLSTEKVMRKGLNYVPEDRFLNSIFKIADVATNISAASFDTASHFFFNFKKEKQLTDGGIQDFRIKVTSAGQIMGSLSGGNQQKVVIARALSTKPSVLILDEPTRGIDAAARGDVYHIINQLKAQGVAILLISSDMEEIIELSDRALSMYCGRINRCFEKSQINQDNIMSAAFGLAKGGNA